MGQQRLAAALIDGQRFGAPAQLSLADHQPAVKAFRRRFDFDDPMVAIEGGRPVFFLFQQRAEALRQFQKMAAQAFPKGQGPGGGFAFQKMPAVAVQGGLQRLPVALFRSVGDAVERQGVAQTQ